MTTEDILTNAKRIRSVTEKLSRPEQLAWFGKELGIDHPRLLRLMGYSPGTIKSKLAAGATFTELAEAKPEQTVWVSELFLELADRSGYDMGRLAHRLTAPRPARQSGGDFGTKAAAKRVGGKAPRRASAELLGAIRAGGPDVLDHLTDYLRPRVAKGGVRPRKPA